MKEIISILLIVMSCKSYSQSEKLIGEWGNCKDVCNGITTMKNVCTKFEFKSDETLLIIYPEYREKLSWKIENQNISFSSSSDAKSDMFSIGELYDLNFNDNFEQLIICEKKDKECYIVLGRK
ncbi:hypothetical protein [Flavobacterium sp. 3HN19-14]|uniref:hypothetical protein n=1 Tax=Flavobacterium sp. 3HN19-14 TaxID=3448133 RepID=UPI003EDED8EC